MGESLDEGMTGMGDPAGYDDWGREEPTPPDRLVELATQFAELAGLTVGPAAAPERGAPPMVVKLTCGRCNGTVFLARLRTDPGVTNELYDTHLCTGIVDGATVGPPAIFPFTLAARSGA